MSETVLNQVVKRVIQTYCIFRKGTKNMKTNKKNQLYKNHRQSSLRAMPKQTANMHCENAVYTSRTVYFVPIFYLLYITSVVFICCFDSEACFVVCVCLNNLRVLDHVKCE